MDENNDRDWLQAKMDAVARGSARGKLTKREFVLRLSQVLKRVNDAQFMRREENRAAGRDNREDDLLEALDVAETRSMQLGAMPTVRG